jgi:hypothetical protein
MIVGFIARLFGLSTLLSTTLVWGGIALAAWGAWTYQHHRGVVQGRAEIQAKWDKAVIAEADRVAKAVAEAQAEAQKTIDALEKREEELNAELIDQAVQAAADPGADDCGLGADSVRRLQRLR